jgi:hypothetical protein
MNTKGLAKRLFEATKVSELTDLINDLSDEEGIKWRPVGGNDNNLAIIGIGSDPAAGVIERVTNAIDSIIELEWMTRGQPPNITYPRLAVEKWFGIKGGRLTGYKSADLKKLEKIAKSVEVSLRDSDRDDKPTVDIRDFGIGLASEEFGDSILRTYP